METEKKKPTKTVRSRKTVVQKTIQSKPVLPSTSAGNNKISPSNGLFVVVVVLVVMSAIQVFQTQQLLNAVSSGAVKVGAPSQGGSVDLPGQVGGC
ncbi:MAG: hypothetical protein Q8P72_05755 [Candidatus Roizmanbacteria bacterium]|nr:hypothetical protein [Candidatus Roizmanbacteria bacterium]